MLRAAVYVRISMDREGRRAGVERQRQDCLAICERRGWKVHEVYEDNDRSAFSEGSKRPAYDRLCSDVADGHVDVVVAYNQDRLWRSVIEQQLFLSEGRTVGLKLVATTSGDLDPADADNEFVSTVLAAMARKESQNTSRRMKRKQLEKAQRGEAHGGRRAFGHTQDRMKLVPDEAKLIREAAKRMLRGDSMRSIVLDWRSRGIKTANGKEWSVPVLADLIKQPRLMGVREHHGALYPTKWAVILDPETFERVQAISAQRKLGPGRRAATRHLLTGILRCEKCGAPMKGGHRTTKAGEPQARYLCPAPGIGNSGCGGTVIMGAETDAAVTDLVIEYLDTPKLARAIERAERATSDSGIGRIVEALEKDRAKLGELGDSYADGDIDRGEYKRLTERLRSRVATNERKLTDVASVPHLEYVGRGGRLRKAWPRLTFDEQRDVLLSVLDHVDVLEAQRPVNRFQADRLVPHFRY